MEQSAKHDPRKLIHRSRSELSMQCTPPLTQKLSTGKRAAGKYWAWLRWQSNQWGKATRLCPYTTTRCRQDLRGPCALEFGKKDIEIQYSTISKIENRPTWSDFQRNLSWQVNGKRASFKNIIGICSPKLFQNGPRIIVKMFQEYFKMTPE